MRMNLTATGVAQWSEQTAV